MTLTWDSFTRPFGTKLSEVLEHFMDTILQAATNWQNHGGGAPAADKLFDGGLAGGLIQRISDGQRFAWYYGYDPAGSQTDKFGITVQNGTDSGGSEWDSVGLMACVQDLDNAVWADKTEFFGPEAISSIRVHTIVAGPFERGETVTIDPGGSPETFVLIDHITELDTLVFDTLSATLASLEGLSIQGGTSGATAIIETAPSVLAHHRTSAVSTFFLRGGSVFPEVSDVLVGQTSGHIGTVATIDEATGEVTLTGLTGRYAINEIVEWNGGANSLTMAWAPQNFRVFASKGLRVDYDVDDQVVIWGEDADRLLLLIPDPTNSQFIIFGCGKWVDSFEGGGRRDTCISGQSKQVTNNPDAGTNVEGSLAFADHNGVAYAVRSQTGGLVHMGIVHATVDPNVITAGTEIAYWNHTNDDPIERALRPEIRMQDNPNRRVGLLPEFFYLPAAAWKTVASPGTWTNKEPLALFLDDNGFAIQFDNDAITP